MNTLRRLVLVLLLGLFWPRFSPLHQPDAPGFLRFPWSRPANWKAKFLAWADAGAAFAEPVRLFPSRVRPVRRRLFVATHRRPLLF